MKVIDSPLLWALIVCSIVVGGLFYSDPTLDFSQTLDNYLRTL